jgi:hypothetical protein
MAEGNGHRVVGPDGQPVAYGLDMVQTGRVFASPLICTVCEQPFILGIGPPVGFVCAACERFFYAVEDEDDA